MVESYMVEGKKVAKCRDDCPYSSDDGGYPGPVMVCDHPRANETGGDHLGRGVICHPECDTGFPNKCPLRRFAKKEKPVNLLDMTGREVIQSGCHEASQGYRKLAPLETGLLRVATQV